MADQISDKSVILELAKIIHNAEHANKSEPKGEEARLYWLQLFLDCRSVVSGSPPYPAVVRLKKQFEENQS